MADITLDELLYRIDSASSEEIKPIMDALTDRFMALWPGWDLLMLFVPRHDRKTRIRMLENSISLLSHDEKNDLP